LLAFIGLGSNLGDREATIRRAVSLLGSEPGIRVASVSTLRESEPWGFDDQPPFLNGACSVETELCPPKLLQRLQAIETRLGRHRHGPRFGPRTIDLDLLLYGDETIDSPSLVVPHPRLVERAFALEPLVELDPTLCLPGGRRLSDVLAELQ
jgi:2-amino-4-hydroxy-6-hydroxymethyldihydropteridine diphosphokinase